VVLGKSGSGKSITIKCVVGLVGADSGVINVFGTDITKMDTNELNEIRVRMVFFSKRSIIRFHERTKILAFHLKRHAESRQKKLKIR
jgi:phospholipid/cholesterol/gamma-HCH transport system ATP-binding protein